MFGLLFRVLFFSASVAAVATYTPIVQWGFKYGVFDYIFLGIRDEALSKVVKGTGSLEDFSNELTGTKSEFIYGRRVLNPNDEVKKERAHFVGIEREEEFFEIARKRLGQLKEGEESVA